MAVNLRVPAPGDLHAVAGVELGTARAHIRKPGRRDLLVIRLAEGAASAGVFTRNRFCAAPVQVCREHLAGEGGSRVSYWVGLTNETRSLPFTTRTSRTARRARRCCALSAFSV